MIIYIVDDEPLAISLLRRELNQVLPEAEVTSFEKPEDLLKAHKQMPCDIAFLDITMPGMTGIDLAKQLQEYSERVNIIMATGYDEYKGDAMDIFVSGYMTKPVNRAKLELQLAHLRYPIKEKKKIFVRTFGNFCVLVDDQPVAFHRKKSEEALAYLVDRRGAPVRRRELATVVMKEQEYSRPAQKRLDAILNGLKKDLSEAGISRILGHNASGFYVIPEQFTCDLYAFLSGDPLEGCIYKEKYMEKYSWKNKIHERL